MSKSTHNQEKDPISSMDELLNWLHSLSNYTMIELKSSDYQIWFKEENIPKLSFNTHYKRYELTYLPFGLTKAPTIFNSLMVDVFWEQLDDFLHVFFDDIPVYFKEEEEEEHEQHIYHTLQPLKKK